jgi:DNA-binding IclR family transcriptional regulator
MSDYTNSSQQRILRLVLLLAGHEITGLAPADIARQQQCDAPLVTRDLANLREAGFAEQVPETGRWRLSPQVVQIALRHMTALDHAETRLAETRNRYSRTA